MPWAATLDHHCAGARKGLLSSFFALLALACEPVKRHSARRCFLKDPAFVLLSSWPTLRHHHLPLATCHLPLVLVMCAIFQEQLPLVGGLLECCHISICFVDRREGRIHAYFSKNTTPWPKDRESKLYKFKRVS